MARETEVGAAAELCRGLSAVPDGTQWETNGELFAVTRRCRHLGADLANGSVDRQGCLVCPWHGARYDVATGRIHGARRGSSRRFPAPMLATVC